MIKENLKTKKAQGGWQVERKAQGGLYVALKAQGGWQVERKAQGGLYVERKAQGGLYVERKAQGHIEIMLSFVIFIGVLIFVLVYINPLAFGKGKTSSIDEVQRNIINKIQIPVSKLSIILVPSGKCYNFNENDYLKTEQHYREVNEDIRKYDIYFSDIFEQDYSTIKKTDCRKENYTLGIYLEESMIAWEKIEDLAVSYQDYDSLKNSLGISDEFSFNIKDLDGNRIDSLSVTKEIPQGIEVESRDFPIRAINKNAEIKELILNIRTWRI